MVDILEQVRELQKVSIKSKVKFSGNFTKEMENLMKQIEKVVTKEIVPKFHIEYTSYGKNSLKIKINDPEQLIEKLITCNFTYNNTDERYGYVDPQFLVSELSKKTKVYGMGKISILQKERIVESFIKNLLSIIDMY